MRKQLIAISALAFALAAGAGVASMNVQADAASSWSGFEINATAVRIGSGTKQDPSGLRFKTVASDLTEQLKAQYPDAKCYTTISFNSTVVTEENPEGVETPYSIDVPVSVWTDVNSWNTVLLEIPESDYDTVITAQSFIQLDETTVYQTEPVSSSIAKTASLVMAQNNESNEALNKYVANAVESISLNETTGNFEVGDTVQLTATTAPAGFGVLWTSDDPSIATVDGTGKVTVVGAGQATITASMGGKEATYTVTSTIPYVMDFESGVNSYFGTDQNVVASLAGVVEHNGDKELKFDLVGGSTFAFSISHEYLNWAFYQQGAESVSFTLSTDKAITGIYNKCSNAIIYKNTSEVFVASDKEALSSYVLQDDGTMLITLSAVNYTKCYDADGNMLRTINDEAEDTPWYFGIRMNLTVESSGNALGDGNVFYLDDFTVNMPAEPELKDLIDFEDGANGYFGTDQNVVASLSGVVEHNGDNALKFDIVGGSTFAFSISHEYLNWAFYQQGAESVSFTLSTDEAITGTYNMCKTAIIYQNTSGASAVSAKDEISSYVLQDDGTMLITLSAVNYTKSYDVDGNMLRTITDGAADTPWYFGIRLNLKAESNGEALGDGNAFYLDDFTVNMPAPAEPELKDLIDFEDGANGYFGTDQNVVASLSGVVEHNGDNALKFDIVGGSTFAVSISHEYLNWAFYQQGATSISFTLSTDEAITGTYNKCKMALVYLNTSGEYGTLDKVDVDYVFQDDGTLRITLTSAIYTKYFDEDGNMVRTTPTDVADGAPYYCSIRLNLKAESNGEALGNGNVFYLDDFTVNY